MDNLLLRVGALGATVWLTKHRTGGPTTVKPMVWQGDLADSVGLWKVQVPSTIEIAKIPSNLETAMP